MEWINYLSVCDEWCWWEVIIYLLIVFFTLISFFPNFICLLEVLVRGLKFDCWMHIPFRNILIALKKMMRCLILLTLKVLSVGVHETLNIAVGSLLLVDAVGVSYLWIYIGFLLFKLGKYESFSNWHGVWIWDMCVSLAAFSFFSASLWHTGCLLSVIILKSSGVKEIC